MSAEQDPRSSPARRGRWTRTALGLRAALAALLAVGAAALAVDLADWRYRRVDLTARHSNTLDPAVLDVIDKLPEPVAIDVFTRPLKYPYDGVFRAAEERLFEFLAVVRNARRGRVEVKIHDPKEFEATQERLRQLNTEGTNKIVLSCGERRDELALFGELATVDWGNPGGDLARYLIDQGIPGVFDPRGFQPGRVRPAMLQDFRGEELLTESLLKVSSGEAPRVYFVHGHGEPALDGTEPNEHAGLRAALERDGFEVAEWDPLKRPEVPEDCSVLALIGAQQPYQQATRDAIKAYSDAGGRIMAAPDISELHPPREGGIIEVLRGFGIATQPGIVCQPLVGFGGEKAEGSEQCAWLVIDERGMQPGSPLTEPLRMRGRRVQFSLTLSFDSASPDDGAALVLPLVSSPRDSWRDLEKYDFRFDAAKGEKRDPCMLVTAKQLPSVRSEDGSVRQGRLVAVASAYFFGNQLLDENRDFIVNAFNWLAEREYRIAVRPLEKSLSFLDFERGTAKPALTYTLWLGLPGLCGAIGLVVFLRRRT